MKHLYINWILTLSVFLLVASSGQSQSAETENTYPASKYELGIGFGIDHSALGFKGKYNLTKRLSVYAAVGIQQIIDLVPPSAGLQYKWIESKSSKWTGYVLSQVSMVRFQLDSLDEPFINPPFVIESQRQFFFTVGGGAMWRVNKRYSVNFGVTYSVYDVENRIEFYDKFNAAQGTSFDFNRSRRGLLRPILGVNQYY